MVGRLTLSCYSVRAPDLMTWQWPTLLIAGAIVLFAYRYGRPGRGCLPPGPPPLPVIGNALDFPRRHLGRELRELSLKYGESKNYILERSCQLNDHRIRRRCIPEGPRAIYYSFGIL